ncbi:hypothetical protein D9M71_623720 [compost metagenome]
MPGTLNLVASTGAWPWLMLAQNRLSPQATRCRPALSDRYWVSPSSKLPYTYASSSRAALPLRRRVSSLKPSLWPVLFTVSGESLAFFWL